MVLDSVPGMQHWAAALVASPFCVSGGQVLAGIAGGSALRAEALHGKGVRLLGRADWPVAVHLERHAAAKATQFVKSRGSQANPPHLEEVLA